MIKEGKLWKAKLKFSIEGKTASELRQMLGEKRKELSRHEWASRLDGFCKNRVAYNSQASFRVAELKKEIAFILSKLTMLSWQQNSIKLKHNPS